MIEKRKNDSCSKRGCTINDCYFTTNSKYAKETRIGVTDKEKVIELIEQRGIKYEEAIIYADENQIGSIISIVFDSKNNSKKDETEIGRGGQKSI